MKLLELLAKGQSLVYLVEFDKLEIENFAPLNINFSKIDPQINRFVIKIFTLEYQLSIEDQILSQLNHPNIIPFFGKYDVSIIPEIKYKIPGSTYFLLFPYLEAYPLRYLYSVRAHFDVISDSFLIDFVPKSEFEKFDFVTKSKIIIQILDTIDYLHRIFITHGDLHANNILVDKNNFITIIDFGSSIKHKHNTNDIEVQKLHFFEQKKKEDILSLVNIIRFLIRSTSYRDTLKIPFQNLTRSVVILNEISVSDLKYWFQFYSHKIRSLAKL